MQITHVIVHTEEQAREIVSAAMSIADDLGRSNGESALIFREACKLLGQRFTLAYEPPKFQMPPMAVPGNGMRS